MRAGGGEEVSGGGAEGGSSSSLVTAAETDAVMADWFLAGGQRLICRVQQLLFSALFPSFEGKMEKRVSGSDLDPISVFLGR